MKEINIKENTDKIKSFIEKLPKKTMKLVIIAAVAVVLVATVLTIILNSSSGNYVTLYPNLSASESGSVYQALIDMGAKAKIGPEGSVQVPSNEYDIWILQLAAKGYPKSALPYDIFSSHSGMTSTESEKAQWLLYQLQDRIQSTLERMDCVSSATVTITVPETSDYVWDTATNKESASAGVLLTLKSGVTITGDQVSAIRNLIAASVPKMLAENVKVVDSSTMLELSPSGGSNATSTTGGLDFELLVQKQIEDNVDKLLASRYGSNGVVAVAKVTIDYDKMMTEKYDVSPNTNGTGYVTKNSGTYSINGEASAGSVIGSTSGNTTATPGASATPGATATPGTGSTAGVSSNTGIPSYAYTSPNSQNGMTNYTWSNDYDYSYIKTQIESGNAILKRATISVLVNDSSLTSDKKDELVNLVSGCTDIPADLIVISSFTQQLSSTPPDSTATTQPSILDLDFLNLPKWVYIAAGCALLLIIIIVVVVIALLKRGKKAKLRALAESEEKAKLEEQKRKQSEIETYKRSLEDMAKGNIDPKDEAIMTEVRNFAKENPQVTANLLKSWLKEE